MQNELKIVRQDFRIIGKCDILPFLKKKIAQNLSYRFFLNLGCSGCNSPLKTNCKSFIMGCTVGFREILGQIYIGVYDLRRESKLCMPFSLSTR